MKSRLTELLVLATACLSAWGAADSSTDAAGPALDFAARREAFVEHCVSGRGGGAYAELIRLSVGQAVNEGDLRSTLDVIDQRRDCADFRVHAILRLLYQYGDNPALSEDMLAQCRRTLLDFKYWPDEPGIDSMCSWSENHQIMFAAGGYLAGQLFPDAVFANSGQTGREKMASHRPRILRWMDLRFRTGFSEWLSNVYYVEDLTPLLNLVDYCQDQEIADRAAMVVDLLLADMALNSFRGTFGSTHGRTYEHQKKWGARESTSSTQKLMFGLGDLSGGNMSSICLALSERYRMPRVLYAIANDQERPEMLNRQRMGIRLAEAERWGLGFDNFEDGMVFLSLEAYSHPRTINLVMDMFDAFHWWDNDFFAPYRPYRGFLEMSRTLGLLPVVAYLFERDVCRNTREEVNIYTYRTADYMLSSAQDYRRGYGGDQQHIWQATLGPNAACFTTHPPCREGKSPSYWVGSGNLPRAAQVENVVLAIYRISDMPALYVKNELFFTHAWLPKDQFDEVVEQDGWICARRGQGYLALRSQHPYHWQDQPGEDKDREVIVPGRRNVWVCELGREAVDGAFADFVARICAAPMMFDNLAVSYESPSQGRLEFGWTGPLLQDGREVPLHDYPRFDNPYTDVAFPPDTITFRHGDDWLSLDWPNATREASAFEETP